MPRRPDDGFIDLDAVPEDTSTRPDGTTTTTSAALIHQLARKRVEASIIVPTDDTRVQTRLRQLCEPITLFAESPADRRDRLRSILVDIELGESPTGGDVPMTDSPGVTGLDRTNDSDAEPNRDAGSTAAGPADEEFFTPGSDQLRLARSSIATFSLDRARRRLAFQRRECTIPPSDQLSHRNKVKQHLSGFGLFGSQLAGDRPVTAARISPNDDVVATGSVDGTITLFDIPSLTPTTTLRGHTGRIGGLAWFPSSSHKPTSPSTTTTQPPTEPTSTIPQLASSAADGVINLWNTSNPTPISTLVGHSARVCRLDIHPSGSFIGSASYDTSWRLWDVTTSTELLLQQGHSREVYAIAFHPDGSLVATAGLDAVGRVWDLRSGRSVMVLTGHVGPIYGLDWSPDGVRLLSGSADGFVKCWDMRAVAETAAIAAHSGGVADVRWFRGQDGPMNQRRGADGADDDAMADVNTDTADSATATPKSAGSFFVSAGFDKNVTLFSADDWAVASTLAGHSAHPFAVDVASHAGFVVSAGQDRTVKLWCRDDMAELYDR